MKTAIYVEDGVVQLVLTPESEFEKNCMTTFRDKHLEVKLFSGWVRQTNYSGDYSYTTARKEDQSLILKVGTCPVPAEPETCSPVADSGAG